MGLFKGNRYHGVLHDPRLHISDKPKEIRLTLLINYWRMRDVGENYTHVLPQENLYLRMFEDIHKSLLVDKSNDSDCSNYSVPFADDIDDDRMFNYPPREVQYTEVPVKHDITNYLEYFQNQTLAPDLFEGILAAQQSQMRSNLDLVSSNVISEGMTWKWTTPVSLLSFPRNSSLTAYCNDLIRNHNMSLARFMAHSRDEATGQIKVLRLGTVESQTEWRKQWPYLPEDHEKQVREMFI